MAVKIFNPMRWQKAGKNKSTGFSENWEPGTESGILWRL